MNEIELIDINQVLKLPKSTLLDIREIIEFNDFNIGGINIPSHEVMNNYEKLSQFDHIIVVCSNGTRSNIIARVLGKKLPNTTIYHLTEGIF